MRRRWLLLYPVAVLVGLFAWFMVGLPAHLGEAVGGLSLPPAVGSILYLVVVPLALLALGLWQWVAYMRRVPADRVVSGALFLLAGLITLGLFLSFTRWVDSRWQVSATTAALINGPKKVQGEIDNLRAAGKPVPVRDGVVDLAALFGASACPENKDRHGHDLFPTPCPWQFRLAADGRTAEFTNRDQLLRSNPHLDDFTRLPGAFAVLVGWLSVWLGLGANFNLWLDCLARGPAAPAVRLIGPAVRAANG